jgi:phospholipid/cholesterol/gamma-HCH transport system substrate-binding protein
MAFFTKEVKLGIAAVAALLIIYMGFIFLKGINLFNDTDIYYVKLNNISGLAPQSDVILSGMKIGSVEDIEYNHTERNVIITIGINKGFDVYKGCTASLTKEMLGSTKLDLIMPDNNNSKLAPGDTITGKESVDLMASAGEMVPQVQMLLPKIDSILTSINSMLNDPSISASLHNIETLTYELNTTTNKINHILSKDVPSMLDKANNICYNMEEITSSLKTVDFKGMESNINSTMHNLQLFSNRLNNPNSNLGLLLNDNNLYNNLDSTLRNASLLLEDLRLHPKRYVHFSLFGRKE